MLRLPSPPICMLTISLLSIGHLHAQHTSSPVSLAAASTNPILLPDAPLPEPRQQTSNQLPSASPFPTARQRRSHFLTDLLGPTAFIAPAFTAAIDTARPLKVAFPSDGFQAPGLHPAHGTVPEWGEGAQGFAKRYADRFGQGLISTTSRYALGELLRQDVAYHRCLCTGLLPRTGHAVLGAYLAHTRSGRTVPSLPALASPYIASEVAVAAWYPNRFNATDALRTSSLNYISAPFKNLFTEFITR